MRPGGTAKDLQETLARLLADAAVAEYAEQYDQLSLPPVFFNRFPPKPDTAILITVYDRLPVRNPNLEGCRVWKVQARCRARVSAAPLAEAVEDALVGDQKAPNIAHVSEPTRLPLGPDRTGRDELSLNFTIVTNH